jgi:hypothetical protein
MFGIHTCRISEKLTKGLDDALRTIMELEMNQALSPLQASERYVAAETAWIEHKMSCRHCSGQQFGKVH